MPTHKAIPCCVARRSVSTCGDHQVTLNEPPVSIGLGSHSHKRSLTRQAKSVVFGVWQRRLSFALTADARHHVQGTVKNGAPIVLDLTTSANAKNDGIGRTARKATTKRDQRITTGEGGDRRRTTRRSRTRFTAVSVFVVGNQQYWSTTKTTIDPIATPRTSSLSANVAIRLMCITAQPTCPRIYTPRRYSQRPGKPGNHVLNYGEGPMKLGKTLGVSKDAAKSLMQQYFEPYPKVEEFINGVHSYILDHAMVETILGRPRRFHEMIAIGQMLDRMTRWNLPGTAKANLARAERQSVNSVIQGSAADVAKMAMIKCEFDERLQSLGVQQLLQVHDELMFEVPEESADEALPIICELMEHPFEDELSVPLAVDAGMGYSWSSAKA